MAVIDTFLNLLSAQQAERLVLEQEEVPVVFRGEESIRLAMPAVPTDLVRRLSREVIGLEEEPGEEAVEGSYRSGEGQEYTYRIHAGASHCRIELCTIIEADESAPAEAHSPSASRGTVPSPDSRTSSPPPHAAEVSGGAPQDGLREAIEAAVDADASDLFLSSGRPPRVRVDGRLETLPHDPTSEALIRCLLPDDQARTELESLGSADFGVTWDLPGGARRFRVNIFHHARGLAAALRPIRSRLPGLEDLHLPGDLCTLVDFPHGLVLVTGAAGSGKSTTLAALVDHLNQSRDCHIITIEDPIEFEHRDARALIHQRELGHGVESFSDGLRAALRESPDVILLGEMRDPPTISAALTAAETGHLVLSTLHTGSATAAVSRITDAFPGHQQPHVRQQLAASLRAVVAQRLVPAAHGRGRFPAIEKLLVTPAVANSIREGHEHHMRSAMQTGLDQGMLTLERSLASLERRGRITRRTALREAVDREALEKLLSPG